MYSIYFIPHRSLIQICITPSVESTPGFFPSASPVMSRLTSSFTCQPISVIIITLVIHPSFTPGLKPTFSTNLSHLNTFSTMNCLFTITGPDRIDHVSLFIFSAFFSLIFLFIPCGGLTLNTQYIWYRIVSYRI